MERFERVHKVVQKATVDLNEEYDISEEDMRLLQAGISALKPTEEGVKIFCRQTNRQM